MHHRKFEPAASRRATRECAKWRDDAARSRRVSVRVPSPHCVRSGHSLRSPLSPLAAPPHVLFPSSSHSSSHSTFPRSFPRVLEVSRVFFNSALVLPRFAHFSRWIQAIVEHFTMSIDFIHCESVMLSFSLYSPWNSLHCSNCLHYSNSTIRRPLSQ